MATMPLTTLSFPPIAVQSDNEIIGANQGLRHVMETVRMVAPTDAAVMLKARPVPVRKSSPGRSMNRAAVAALPTSRSTVPLFPPASWRASCSATSAEPYTGAWTQTTGRFQLADQGTLFLDEIGDLPLELQPKLLRILQEQEFERLGSSRTISVDVRVIAATNLDLAQMVRERRFRADLYYRLNVIPIAIPALRDRTEDIPQLVWHFVRRFAGRMNKDIAVIPDEVMEMLKRHDWPGNIRELQNFIERAVLWARVPCFALHSRT